MYSREVMQRDEYIKALQHAYDGLQAAFPHADRIRDILGPIMAGTQETLTRLEEEPVSVLVLSPTDDQGTDYALPKGKTCWIEFDDERVLYLVNSDAPYVEVYSNVDGGPMERSLGRLDLHQDRYYYGSGATGLVTVFTCDRDPSKEPKAQKLFFYVNGPYDTADIAYMVGTQGTEPYEGTAPDFDDLEDEG